MGRFSKIFRVIALFGVSVSLLSCNFKSHSEPLNTLHVVSSAKIKGLDPIYADDLYAGTQSSQAYESLYEYHYLKRPYVIIPSLAESLPQVSSDGLTYVIQLKKGTHFQDDPSFKATQGKGRELTADDVVYSFKRLADPQLNSSGWWILDGRVTGLNAWRDKASQAGVTDYASPVEGLKSIGPYTVQIKLVQRSSQLLYFLAMPFTAIVPREAVEQYGKEFLNHAVGTGPFRLAEYNPNSKITWVRNPTYRKDSYPSDGSVGDRESGLLDDAGKMLPLVEQVNVDILVEQQPMWLNFMAGRIDLAGIPKDNFSSAITGNKELTPELKSKGVRLTVSPGLDITHVTFNMSDPLLGKNKYLRQALSLVYDQVGFIDLFYNGRALAANGPIPPGLSGYDPNLKNPYREFNISRAKKLLEKAGYPGGKGLPPLQYATLADSTARQMTEYIQKMMSVVGVTLKVDSYAWPQFLEVVKNRRSQIWEYAWSADYPDAENFLQLFYSKNSSPGPNDSNYSNPEFDRLYEKSLTLADGTERTHLYQKMVSLLVEDCPWIFGAHRLSYVLTQPWLRNFKVDEFDHGLYKYYRIDKPSQSESK